MLTFLFALASIWTLFWLVMLLLDWGKHTPLSETNYDQNALPANSSANLSATDDDVTKPATATPATATNLAATSTASDSIASNSNEEKTVPNEQNQSNVTPLFDKPEETDDLKVIKGIGVVMEQTLNDLGITTFKQLAGFTQAEVKMVSDVLSESNAGFGDRIERDEWVSQAKSLVNKAN